MRFFKSFTLLHRKSKSDGNVTIKATPRGHVQTRSLSFVSAQHFDEQVLVTDNALFNAVVPNNATHIAPVTLPATTLPADPQVSKSIHTTSSQTPALYQRIRALETENAMLKSASRVHSSTVENALNHRIRLLESEIAQANSTIQALSNSTSGLQATIEDLQDEIRTTRDQLYDTLQRDALLRRQTKADDEEIQRLEEQLMQCTKFLGLVIDIGLHEPVLARVQVALRVGEDADEALIESIQEAAARPGSPWARIIPAITGPRTPDNYISAINTTLKVRKQLKDCKKVAKFWKQTAKEGGGHADTITPSTSTISSICEVLSEERQYAVDELLDKIKNGPRSTGAMPTFAMPVSQPAIVDDVFSTPVNLETTVASAATFSDPCGYANPIRDCTSPVLGSDTSVRNSTSTICGRYVPNLAPLASQSFKEELVASESFKHLSKRTSASYAKVPTRTILGDVDLNRDLNTGSKMLASDSMTTQGSKRSAKALGKRRAIVVAESIESIEAIYGSSRSLAPPADQTTGGGDLFVCPVLCNQERWQNDDTHHISIDSGGPTNDSTRYTLASNTPDFPGRTLVMINEESGNISTGSSTSTSVGKLGDRGESDTSATTTNVNLGDDSEEVCSTLLPEDFSFVAESIISTPPGSPAKDAVVTPSRASPAKMTTPVVLSRLPVFKHFRRLSISVGLSKGGPTTNTGLKLRTPTPLSIVKKKSLVDMVRSTPTKATSQTPTSSTPSSIVTPSRLSTPTKNASAGRRLVNSGRRAARTLSRIVP